LHIDQVGYVRATDFSEVDCNIGDLAFGSEDDYFASALLSEKVYENEKSSANESEKAKASENPSAIEMSKESDEVRVNATRHENPFCAEENCAIPVLNEADFKVPAPVPQPDQP